MELSEKGQNTPEFRLPDYIEIPDVGLYLEQTVKFISEYMKSVPSVTITGSMISNYVKKGLVKNPVKKQYYRDQIAIIIFIAVAKTVISLEQIQILLNMQEQTCPVKQAYEYFCRELGNVLEAVFHSEEAGREQAEEYPEERELLHKVIVTVAHKIYLEHIFDTLSIKDQ